MSADDHPGNPPALPAGPHPYPQVDDQHHDRGPAVGTEDTMDPIAPEPSWAPGQEPAELTGPAVGTLAWGLVVLAVAGVLLAREVTDLTVDLSYALPLGMVALGLLLVVGAVLTGIRRR